MKQRVAVFDWDKTVIKNFANDVLYETLAEQGLVSFDFLTERKANQTAYINKLISHDDLVEKNRLLLENNICGLHVNDFRVALQYYKNKQCQQFYDFLPENIFPQLKEHGIAIIAITAALKDVIDLYKSDFNLWMTIGTECESIDGIYTGRCAGYIGTSYGKQQVINRLFQENDWNCIFAFGDSHSDIPLLEVSQYGFVNNTTRFYERNGIEYYDFDDCNTGMMITKKVMDCIFQAR